MALILWVYRNGEGTDATNEGVSSKANRLLVVNVDGPFDDSLEYPKVMLMRGNLRETLKIVPVDEDGKPITGGMFGGNFAYSCDSRFSRKCEDLSGSTHYGAVPIHDRFE